MDGWTQNLLWNANTYIWDEDINAESNIFPIFKSHIDRDKLVSANYKGSSEFVIWKNNF
jgi:hypothetical protein